MSAVSCDALTEPARPPEHPLPECCRKKLNGGEVYRYFGRNFVFDVDRANELIRDGRQPIEVEDESVRRSVELCRIREEHVAHVNPARPGIIAHVECLADDGEVVKGHVLIDGNHRAARCLELALPFYAYVLSEEESESILLRKPSQTFARVQDAAASDGEADAATEPGA
jgi:hypothetical protein